MSVDLALLVFEWYDWTSELRCNLDSKASSGRGAPGPIPDPIKSIIRVVIKTRRPMAQEGRVVPNNCDRESHYSERTSGRVKALRD